MPFDADKRLLSDVTAAVKAAGVTLRDRYTPHARGVSLDEVVGEIHANDDAVLDVLREPLLQARPGSQWAEDELAGGALPAGEWWVVDPAEGNINHVHGMDDWAVTATLVRDNQPVLTVVHLPLTGDTYTAVAGGGARLNDRPLKVSAKTDLGAALVGTGQARPGPARTSARSGGSVTPSPPCSSAAWSCACPCPPRCNSSTSPPDARTRSGSSPTSAPAWSPAPCWSPKPEAPSPT